MYLQIIFFFLHQNKHVHAIGCFPHRRQMSFTFLDNMKREHGGQATMYQ